MLFKDRHIPLIIGTAIFTPVLLMMESIMGPALTYGGNLCTDTDNMVVTCGVPPVGMSAAACIAVIGTFAINRWIKRSLSRIADEHGSLACLLLGHNWDLEPPWSGKELRYQPQCERCGHEPDEIAITGSHEGDHRV
jgi:hypothetical protein